MDVRIHRILTGSRANGPGIRNTVWFQGCTLSCPGCFNPLTHDPKGGRLISTEDLCGILLDPQVPCEGITISGGEPFQQPGALLELLQLLRTRQSPPILVFSGYEDEELRSVPQRAVCLDLIDALICGPYKADQPPADERFCSSENQRLILLSDRYTAADFRGLPLREAIIGRDGNVIFSGIIS